MKIIVSRYPDSYSLENIKLLQVTEKKELEIIPNQKIEWPYLNIKTELEGKDFSFFMPAPRFINIKGGKVKNYVIPYNYQSFEQNPRDYKKVVGSFAMIVIDLLGNEYSYTNPYDAKRKVILDLTGNPKFLLDHHPLGCPACGQNDDILLQSALNDTERDTVEHWGYEKIKDLLVKAGYSENVSDGFIFKDYDTLTDVYDLFSRNIPIGGTL